MIQFDAPERANGALRQNEAGGPADNPSRWGEFRSPGRAADTAPAPDDGIPYVSPPMMPFPRVLPGL